MSIMAGLCGMLDPRKDRGKTPAVPTQMGGVD